MPGRKISQLPLASTINGDSVPDVGDLIPAIRSGTTVTLKGESLVHNLSSVGSGIHLNESNFFTAGVGHTLPIRTITATAPLNVSVGADGHTINHSISLGNSLQLKNGKLDINVSTGGGLQLNSDGQLSIATASAPPAIIAVRPSDSNSTDDANTQRKQVTTGNDQGVLQPYFKTLGAASYYANSNFAGNYTVYVDGDTIEGSNYYGWGTPNNLVDEGNGYIFKYLSQTDINNLGSNWSSLKPGIFVWNKYASIGGFFTGSPAFKAGYFAVQGKGTVSGRFYRSSINGWDSTRMFTDVPPKINHRMYYDSTGNLTPGTLGSDPTVWTKFAPSNLPTTKTGYLPGRPIYFNNSLGTDIDNLNFCFTTNANDSTALYVGSGNVSISNVTVTLDGNGYWSWGYVYGDNGCQIYMSGALMEDPLSYNSGGLGVNSSIRSYPGYALAAIGSSDPTHPAVVSQIINAKGSTCKRVTVEDYGSFTTNYYGGIGLQSSIILDGAINIEESFLHMEDKVYVDASHLYLSGSSLSLTTSGINYANTNGTALATNINSIIGVAINQGCQIVQNQPSYITTWTYHRLAFTPAPATIVPAAAYGIPLFYKTAPGSTYLPYNASVTNNLITFNNAYVGYTQNELATCPLTSLPNVTRAEASYESIYVNSYTPNGSTPFTAYGSTTLLPYTALYTLTNAYGATHTLVYR